MEDTLRVDIDAIISILGVLILVLMEDTLRDQKNCIMSNNTMS